MIKFESKKIKNKKIKKWKVKTKRKQIQNSEKKFNKSKCISSRFSRFKIPELKNGKEYQTRSHSVQSYPTSNVERST